MHPERDNVIHLRAGGVSVVFDARRALPRVLHWGADLGDLSTEELDAFALIAGPSQLHNSPDEPRAFTVWPTQFDGWSGTPAITGHRAGVATTPRVALDRVERDLEPDGGTGITFWLTDRVSLLEIRLTYRLTTQGLVEVQSTVRSTAEAESAVYDLGSVLTLMPVPTRAGEIVDFTGKWCRERSPQRGPLRDGSYTRNVRRGKPGADTPYLLMVGTPDFGFRHGEIWATHVAWSGDQTWLAERLPEGAGGSSSVLGGGEALVPGEIRLAAGESYTSPVTVFGWSDSGMDGLADRMHARLRARPQHPKSPRPLVLNTWEAVYFDHDIDLLSELTDLAAEVGIERVVLDDGWFGGRRNDAAGLGDWTVSADAWPNGLHALVDRVRAHGMSFGLWFEPEMVNLDSDLARLHPEWILAPSAGVGPSARHQYVLDIARPDSFAYLLEHIDSLVTEYAIDFIKWDHNRDLLEAVMREPSGDIPGVHRQTAALYALIDELRVRHPALEIESCSAGGGRIDLGILDRTDRVWASDCNDPIERQAIQQWTGLLLPPELVGSHVGAARSHTTARVADAPYRFITALFASAGVEWDLTATTSEELASVKVWAALYKEFRGLIHSGRSVHADLLDDAVQLHGSVAQDGSHALFAWVRLATSGAGQAGLTQIPGLDPSRNYAVRVRTDLGEPSLHQGLGPGWFEAARAGSLTVSGHVLSTVGLTMPTLNPSQALLLEFTAV
ncbi:alpha-galactosidase [Lacisediminihabitans sp. G11-30]|uniref:alpha-galactosidase n=2 Tax=Lacisediminihabitans changchengi TaxID=2787634 RepID=A0A934W0X0_9MICO|nr:alpha-galactosidase [Lacisediminihabitans changchengi]